MAKLDKRIDNIELDINTIKENHLTHIEIDIAKTATNVDWVMKAIWVVATASIGGLVTSLITLITKLN